MKLNEQLIEIVEHEARGAIDTLRHVTPLGHIESVLTEAAERITQLDSDNAALTKRLAELESAVSKQLDWLSGARDKIESLQSQLAWTPVSAGLPTEPGWYEIGSSHKRALDVFLLLQETDGLWWWLRNTRYESPLERYPSANIYRRIELPKDGES